MAGEQLNPDDKGLDGRTSINRDKVIVQLVILV